jgi:pSer/pThr/pTyr-binding forkhead associated (FHA) protein
MQIKRIKCPKCNVVLDIKNKEDKPELQLSCPKCGTLLKVKFSPKSEPVEAPTFFAAPKPQSQLRVDSCATQLAGFNATPQSAKASLICGGREYTLVEGRNVIGRKSPTSNANIQLSTNDPYMSRHHCIINLTTMPDGRKKAVLSNYQNKNATLVNGQRLLPGDVIILQKGNTVTLGKTTITYQN